MNFAENNRILVVDDNPAIHDDFRKILAPNTGRTAELSAAEAVLFSTPERPTARKQFEIHSAFQGEEAVEKVRAAAESGCALRAGVCGCADAARLGWRGDDHAAVGDRA